MKDSTVNWEIRAAVSISTEGDPFWGNIFFNNKNNIKLSNSLFLKENGLKVLMGTEGKGGKKGAGSAQRFPQPTLLFMNCLSGVLLKREL